MRSNIFVVTVYLTVFAGRTLSNALWVAATATTRPAGDDALPHPPALLALLAVGTCVLAAWTAVRIARPEKFFLRRTPGRPNRVSLIHVVAVLAAHWLAVAAATLALLKAWGIELEQGASPPPRVWLAAMIFGEAVWLAAGLAVAAMTFRHGLRRGLGLSGRRWLWDTGRALVGYLAVLPLCIGVRLLTALLIRRGLLPIEPRQHPVLEFLQTAAWPGRLAAILAVVVLAPVAEEVFFRGLVQSMLRRYLDNGWAAIVITSIAFAAVHGELYQDMPALFVLALALGYNYERTGRLTAPILLHGTFNGVMVLLKLTT